jgi:DNA mismatch repair ATPase MutS
MEQDIINNYRQQATDAHEQAAKYEKLANKYSLLRLTAFALLVFSVYLAIVTDDIWVFAAGLAVSVFSFAWLVSRQNIYDDLKQYYSDLKKVNENEIESIQKHAGIYYNGSVYINEKHFYNADLDIFGNGSLFQLVNRAGTAPGNTKLAGWLNAAAGKNTILARQQAVKELSETPGWKLNFQTRLLFCLKQPSTQIKDLLAYLKTTLEIKNEKFLSAYSRAVPFLLLLLIGIGLFYPPALYGLGVVMLVNYRMASSRSQLVSMTDLIAGKIGETLFHYSFAFECIEGHNWQSAYAVQLAARIKSGDKKAVSDHIKELSKLMNKLNYRLNLVVGIIMNSIFVWDVRQVIAIENWKRQNHQSLETAFDVIAEFEALISLASLKINYPAWCIPQIADGAGYTVSAQNLAHPLIGSKNRVENDYELLDAFNIDIITGSNMAGKSTFLRTVGINTVLALCGAPVCAGSMQVSVITIISYMRIKDSLNESTSTFKAELDRLQMLLTAVETEPKVFFLIDEMLRGTNSVDKYLGSKAVIEQLIRKKAVGMVATHDLQIAELEKKYPAYVRNFYFDIQVKDGEMLFDYKIKNGECKTFNASLLLKQIGIDVDAE